MCDLHIYRDLTLKRISLRPIRKPPVVYLPVGENEREEEPPEDEDEMERGGRNITTYLPHHKGLNAFYNESQKTTELHFSVQHRDRASVLKLLEKGANPNSIDADGKTSLHIAVEQGRAIIADYLINFGASVNAKCKNGLTALHYACRRLDKDCIEVLLKCRYCDVNIINIEGQSPVYYFIEKPFIDVKVFIKLLNAGGKVEKAAKDFKPLHILAVQSGNSVHAIEYAKILIDKGSLDINQMNSSNDTPLHIAAEFGTEDFVVLLLDNGADFNIANSSGGTALDLALYWDRFSIVAQIMKRVMLQPMSPEIEDIIEDDAHLVALRTKLQDELDALCIKEHHFSYLDVLDADWRKLREFTKSAAICLHMRSLDMRSYRYYGKDIRIKFNDALLRRQFVESGVKFLGDIFQNRLPHLCIERIVRFLSINDLIALRIFSGLHDDGLWNVYYPDFE